MIIKNIYHYSSDFLIKMMKSTKILIFSGRSIFSKFLSSIIFLISCVQFENETDFQWFVSVQHCHQQQQSKLQSWKSSQSHLDCAPIICISTEVSIMNLDMMMTRRCSWDRVSTTPPSLDGRVTEEMGDTFLQKVIKFKPWSVFLLWSKNVSLQLLITQLLI